MRDLRSAVVHMWCSWGLRRSAAAARRAGTEEELLGVRDGELETAQTAALVFPEPSKFFLDIHETLVELPWVLFVGNDKVVLLRSVGVALDESRAAFSSKFVRNQANDYANRDREGTKYYRDTPLVTKLLVDVECLATDEDD